MPTIECWHHEKWERVGLQPSFQPPLWNLKALFASGAMWHSQTWCVSPPCPPSLPPDPNPRHHPPVELQIFHQTVNLTYFAEAEGGKAPIAAARPHYLFFLSDLLLALREIVVNLSGTWKVAVLTVPRRCRPRLGFWCVNPVTVMPKHFGGCDTARGVNAAPCAKDWLAMFE